MFVFCLAQFIPGSDTFSLVPQGESSSYTDYLQTSRQTNKDDFEEYTTSAGSGPLHPKGEASS